jgi:hypothetical protein
MRSENIGFMSETHHDEEGPGMKRNESYHQEMIVDADIDLDGSLLYGANQSVISKCPLSGRNKV